MKQQTAVEWLFENKPAVPLSLFAPKYKFTFAKLPAPGVPFAIKDPFLYTF